jgi:hypothetical protein
MEEIVDLHKVKFTDVSQFLLGEKVIITGYSGESNLPDYKKYIGKIGKIFQIYDRNVRDSNDYFSDKKVYAQFDDSSAAVFFINDLDLAIENEELYKEIKSVRLAQHQLYINYRKEEAKLLRERLFNNNKDILEIFEEVYKDKFDYYINNNKLVCIIHFPEINITNSLKQKHKIIDLYIKLEFRENKTISAFNGTRSTVTYEEKISSYRHSHMSASGNFYQWLSCCVGESEFAQIYSLLHNTFNKNNLLRFLYQLPDYLSWESLEGGPYIKMSNIKQSNLTPPIVTTSDISFTYEKLLANINNLPVKINKELIGIFQIEANKLEEIILPFAGNNVCNKVNNEYFLKNKDDQILNNIKKYNTEMSNITMFNFKGNKIKPKIIANIDSTSNNTNDVPYPSLTEGVLDILTKNFNNYVISETNV